MAALAEEVPAVVVALAAEAALAEVSVAEALVEAVPAEAGKLKYEVKKRNKNQDIRIKTNVLD